MEQWIAILNDICVIAFDLALYMQMTTLRKDTPRNRGILLSGCVVIVLFYFSAITLLAWPIAVSSFVCMTLPSLVLFWIFSKFKDARFFLTFCVVDTVSLVLGFLARYVGVLLGSGGSILSLVILIGGFVLIQRMGKPHFKEYRMMLEYIPTGWKRLTLSTAAIYVTLVLVAAYPKPLVERPEYQSVYLVVCLMVISFYVVFLTTLSVTGKVYLQSKQLQEQQKWYQMAYVDALTGIPNRMAYMEKVHDLERTKEDAPAASVIVLDVDHFKSINDTWGHNTGDLILRHAAEQLRALFSDGENSVYRIGGDEFAALTVGLTEQDILERLQNPEQLRCGDVSYAISYGYGFVNRQENNAVEQAFARADKMLYLRKGQRDTV